MPGHRAPALIARDEDVERLVRLLEARLGTPPALDRLRAAAQLWTANGGTFSTPVLEEDFSKPSPLGRHRVLLPSFKLKSEAFMLTYNGTSITATSFQTCKILRWTRRVTLVRGRGLRVWGCRCKRRTQADTTCTPTSCGLTELVLMCVRWILSTSMDCGPAWMCALPSLPPRLRILLLAMASGMFLS